MRLVLSLAAALGLTVSAGAADPAAHPRRLLFVHAGGYLTADPLTSRAPDGPDRARDAAERLAAALRVPVAKGNDQLFVLADTPATDPHPPTRGALVKALAGFCDTTRAQDRVVVYFGVHAVERGGKAFVVPLDGDLDLPETLLPVAEVYAKLGALAAAQKVVVWDVCRFNPDRVRGRRDPGPMPDGLFNALTAAPPGVQVLVSCSPGERGLEYSAPRGPAALFAGSAYLDALRQAAADDFAALGPGDPLPVGAWNAAAAKTVAAVAGTIGVKQTPVAAGAAPREPTPPDPEADPAKRFDLPAPPKASADVQAILDELALPPVLDDDPAQVAWVPGAPGALKGYEPDVSVEEVLKNGEKYPLRVATLRALQTIRNVWPRGVKDAKAVAPLPAPIPEKVKGRVIQAQEGVALAIAELELALAELEDEAGRRAKEPKRWQAHYDVAVAEVRLRLVMLNELNRQLGNVRTEALPDLPDGAPGWRLTQSDKLASKKDVRELLTAAQEGFAKAAAEHKGTPWAALAARSRAAVPGLRWEPLPAKK